MHNPYQNAVAQLKQVARLLQIDKETVDKLKIPQRLIKKTLQVKMDNGKVKSFAAWRSEHMMPGDRLREASDSILMSAKRK